jgi:methylated-DNA-[protein]-cysteine S-methyltransferase
LNTDNDLQSSVRFCLYDTEFGVAAIAWTANGICGHQLPEKDAQATEARLKSHFPTATASKPPDEIVMLTRRLRRHLEGNVQDFSNVRLDLTGVPPFHTKIYQALQKIPTGKTVSYNDLAALAGSPGAARAVGQAMAKNPISVIVPCHRVLSASGNIGGFTAYGGLDTKRQLLQYESALPAKCAVAPVV